MATININVEENIKSQANELFKSLGLDMTTALNLFLRQAINYGGIPFEIKKPNPYSISSKEEIYAKLKEAEYSLSNGATGVPAKEVMEGLRVKYEKLLR